MTQSCEWLLVMGHVSLLDNARERIQNNKLTKNTTIIRSAVPSAVDPFFSTASTGPWIAGVLWSSYPVPCNCVNGICFNFCFIGTQAVRWGDIPAEAACGPNSVVFTKWSGPLGFCEFPDGFTPPPPTSPPTGPGSNATGFDTFDRAPPGTVFNNPSQVFAVQGLIVTACVVVFLAAIAGCIDAGVEAGSFGAGVLAAFLSLAGWIFTIAAYSLWSDIHYVEELQASNPSAIWMPVWVNQAANQLTAVQVNKFTWGPGWATAITASIIIFFCSVVHCLSLFTRIRKNTWPRQENYAGSEQQMDGDNVVVKV